MRVGPTLLGWVVLPVESNVTFKYPNASQQALFNLLCSPFSNGPFCGICRGKIIRKFKSPSHSSILEALNLFLSLKSFG